MKKVEKITRDELEMKVESINKSYKYDGYVMVTPKSNPHKSFKRRYYESKRINKFYCYFDGDIYSFNFVNFDTSIKTTDVKYEGKYTGVDFDKLPTEPVEPAKVIEIKRNWKDGEVRHEEFDTIIACVEAGIPVYLHGPAGSGKNHTLQQIADELGLDFYFTNSVQQEYKITGFIDAGGNFHETEFYKAFTQGGLFFLDELDASIPEVLVLLNAAIANKYFEFPNGKVFAHPDFKVVAAGNTTGDGANEEYTGRLQLDASTLDRFVFIEFDYSITIEMALAKGNTELVEFVRELRKQAQEKGVRATFSYRAIATIRKLEGKLALNKVLAIGVFKGMDSDTLKTFEATASNKYFREMRRLQQS